MQCSIRLAQAFRPACNLWIKKTATVSLLPSRLISLGNRNSLYKWSVPTSCTANKSYGLYTNQHAQPSLPGAQCSGFHSSPHNNNVGEDHQTKALTVWTNLRQLKSSPLPALTLGLSGLIPFIAMPAYIISSGFYMPEIAYAQCAYGACILSFLGGVRWGFVIPEENPIQPNWVNLGYSVTPSLIAWLGLLVPAPFGSLTVLTGLGFAAYADMVMYGYPPWFKGLRFLLSFVAVLSLWTTFMCYFVCKENPEKPSLITEDSTIE